MEKKTRERWVFCGGPGGGIVSRNEEEKVWKRWVFGLFCCVSLLLFCASSEEKTLYSVVWANQTEGVSCVYCREGVQVESLGGGFNMFQVKPFGRKIPLAPSFCNTPLLMEEIPNNHRLDV